MTATPRFFYLIAKAQREIERAAQIEFAGLGLSAAQSGLLFSIGEDENPLLGTLAERLDLVPSAITGLVERMTRIGLVVRERDATDKRAFRLSLTLHGRQVRREAARRVAALNVRAFAGFSAEDLLTAGNILEALIAALPRAVADDPFLVTNQRSTNV